MSRADKILVLWGLKFLPSTYLEQLSLPSKRAISPALLNRPHISIAILADSLSQPLNVGLCVRCSFYPILPTTGNPVDILSSLLAISKVLQIHHI